ncbi:MAG: hypothetical protein HND47_01105 [Chloroflexi bacterium]|nr:hypothetical protein [Chloroflexota bacterium]
MQIAQLIISRVPADEFSIEKANEIITRCQENLTQPQGTPPASPTAGFGPAAEATPTP